MKIDARLIIALTAAAFLAAGCGGGDKDGDQAADGETVRVILTAGDQMKYDRKVIEVSADATVTLTFEHTGEMPLETMGHNFVLLAAGTDLDAFARAASSARETGYIPARKRDQVIAHTKMLGGGDRDVITFAAPPPGTYKFICSFPGHYLAMQGDFIVR